MRSRSLMMGVVFAARLQPSQATRKLCRPNNTSKVESHQRHENKRIYELRTGMKQYQINERQSHDNYAYCRRVARKCSFRTLRDPRWVPYGPEDQDTVWRLSRERYACLELDLPSVARLIIETNNQQGLGHNFLK